MGIEKQYLSRLTLVDVVLLVAGLLAGGGLLRAAAAAAALGGVHSLLDKIHDDG